MKELSKIKENDVFLANWKERKWGDQKDHCFEGILIALKQENEFRFYDTFWGICEKSNKSWSYAEMIKLFNVDYYCNLNELEKIKKYDVDYYDDKDIFIISEQHGYSKYYYIKKGAEKSKDKMLKVLNKKLEDIKLNIKWETQQIKDINKKIKEVENGNLDIYI